jgi:hypothetical protein
MISFQYFFKDSIYDTWWEKKNVLKNYNKKFNQQIIMDFWMTKFGPYFQKVPILVIFCWIDIFFPLTYIIKSFLNGKSFIWILLIDLIIT